jgi:hypothetical protein
LKIKNVKKSFKIENARIDFLEKFRAWKIKGGVLQHIFFFGTFKEFF